LVGLGVGERPLVSQAVYKFVSFLWCSFTMFSLKAFYRYLMHAKYTLSLFLKMMEKSLLQVGLILRVCTHQQSQVGSHPVQSNSQWCGSNSVAYKQWPPWQCVHTSRVELSQVPQVLLSQESCCCMFHFRQSDSNDLAWQKKWL